MGWLYGSDWSTASKVRDHLRAGLTGAGYTIVKDASTAYGRRYYAAVRGKDGKTNIFVALIERSGSDWGYKDMDESMGPSDPAIDCPLSVLDAASPIEDLYGPVKDDGVAKWASDWRARVRAYHAARTASRASVKSLKYGDKVWIKRARGNPFTVVEASATKLRGYSADDGFTYRLPRTRIERVEPVVGNHTL